jgi:hypothetical protein
MKQRGGKRDNAGRKKKFYESETITLRIPIGSKQEVKDFVIKLREKYEQN